MIMSDSKAGGHRLSQQQRRGRGRLVGCSAVRVCVWGGWVLEGEEIRMEREIEREMEEQENE